MPRFRVMLPERFFSIVADTEEEAKAVVMRVIREDFDTSDLITWEDTGPQEPITARPTK
jgi:hypothetical protein